MPIESKSRFIATTALAFLGLFICQPASADDEAESSPATTQSPSQGRYGPFGLLDHRSIYGKDWFPEPFRVEDTDVGNQFRFDWEHDKSNQFNRDVVSAQLQKSVDVFTFEIQAPYVIGDQGKQGMGTVSVSGRAPFWQQVSKDGFLDNTVGLVFAVGIPTNSPVSKNTAPEPAIFDDLRIGERFSVQTFFGYSWFLGSSPELGAHAFEYQLAFGYSIEDEQLHLPGIERLTPILELVGETAVGARRAGHDNLTGTLGLRFDLKPLGRFQPQLGLAYVFPFDKGGRADLTWGILTSLAIAF